MDIESQNIIWDIETLQETIDVLPYTKLERSALDRAIKALEKQMPKISGCYTCNDTSNSRYYKNQKYQYCPHCGQKIKWD